MRNCFICNNNLVKNYQFVNNYEYLRCSNCGLIYINIIENWNVLYHSYDGGSVKSLRRKLALQVRKFHHYRNFNSSMQRARSIIEFIRAQEINEVQGIKFLDIGCNKGFLLASAIEHSWDVYGIEVVPELLIPFKKKYKQFTKQVVSEKLVDTQNFFKKNFFGIITAIDVIEHFEDPKRDMKIIFSMLRPGGIFVVQTPDTACARAELEGSQWGALKPLEHLHLFNSNNLSLLSEQIGYQKVQFYAPFEEADGNLVAVFKKSG